MPYRTPVFVFGSNDAGIHGRGAAAIARSDYGAVQGIGLGRMNDSYAIPTKSAALKTLPLQVIELHVQDFKAHAAECPDELFFVTRIGCGLAGYTDHEIAPLFAGVGPNVLLPPTWVDILVEEEGPPWE